MDNSERHNLIDRHLVQLREHFSSVHIVAVHHDDSADTSIRFSLGRGPWYERFGAMHEVVIQAIAKEKRRGEMRAEEEDGDDGETI